MKRDWTSRSTILIFALILIVLNLIGLNLFGRIDLTDDGVYSLSDASRDLVGNLDDPVTVTAFFTSDLPAPYSSNRRFLKDKLDDYRAYGGRNFQYRFVDPRDDEKLRQEATRFQIPPVQIQVIESDNVLLKNAYMGLAIQYGGKRESIPVVQDLSTLEYDITSALRRLTRTETPRIGFLSGHGEPDPAQDMPTLHRNLSRNYTVEAISVTNGKIENPPAAMLVVAPTDTIPSEDLRAIDDYIMNGGRVGFLLNRVTADLQSGQASLLTTGLEDMLAGYGVGLGDDLIMDRQSSVVTVQRRQGFFNIPQQVPYPFFPISTSFNPDNRMVNRLRDLMFYFVSTVDTSLTVPEGVDRELLVFSSSRSTTQKGFFFIQPMFEQAQFSDGPFVISAAYRGEFPSAYERGRSSLSTRMAIVGDGDFLNESIIGPVPGNGDFGLNLVDWLVQDEALLSIRTKTIAPRALNEISAGLRPWIKYGNMIGPVLIVVLFGLIRWRTRRNRQIVLVR
ncbi:MAG: GldG family protein [Bacteroidetes bacterium]|nr:GldG family protein [Bacteroidota bacterium]